MDDYVSPEELEIRDYYCGREWQSLWEERVIDGILSRPVGSLTHTEIADIRRVGGLGRRYCSMCGDEMELEQLDWGDLCGHCEYVLDKDD